MENHAQHSVVRHFDVAIIGGSAAGLSAALQLSRQRRSVVVIDSGQPRNAPAGHMHSYLGREGLPPSELLAIGREEVRSFGGEVLSGKAVDITRTDDGKSFIVGLTGGATIVARRVLAATGIRDRLPEIDGLARHWGDSVITCPFCHGYEVRDSRIVQIIDSPIGLHPSVLFRHLSEQLTVVLHGNIDTESPEVAALRTGGVDVVDGQVRRIVDDDSGRLSGVELADGTVLGADAVVITTLAEARIEAFTSLGLKASIHPSGAGEYVEVDQSGATSVAGLYAAGNLTDPSLQVLPSAAAGSRVGAMISFSLAQEDLEAAARPSSNRTDWDTRYSGAHMWSGNPNGTLVNEVSDLEPATALDVGAGEGGDAVWLAEHGWQVTASDIARNALDRIADAAGQRGVDVRCVMADANSVNAFGGERFDLVSAQYASIPRTADDRGVQNLLDSVAPGGTLLVVSHDLTPMRAPVDTEVTSRAIDPDAYLRVEDIAAVVTGSPEWEIVTYETRPRPAGAVSTHHVDDVVLRVRRR